MSPRVGATLREAARSALLPSGRAISAVLAVAACTTGAALLEVREVNRLLSDERSLLVGGGYTLELSSPAGESVDAAACERLAEQNGIQASGAVLSNSLVPFGTYGGSSFRVVRITAGTANVLRLERSKVGQVAIGPALAAELGLSVGDLIAYPLGRQSEVATVVSTETVASFPDLERAIVAESSAMGAADSCLARTTPADYFDLRNGSINGLGATTSSAVAVSEIVPRGLEDSLSDQYVERDTSRAWLFAGVAIAAISELIRRFRRSEISLYRATGFSRVDMLLLLLAEQVIISTVSAGLALSVVASFALEPSRVNVIYFAWWTSVASVTAGTILQWPLIAWSALRGSLMDGLKDRS